MTNPTVQVEGGKLRGKYSISNEGVQSIHFLGIPFAKPPIGNLRFKAPREPDPWTGIRDATVEQNVCYSIFDRTGEIVGSEDCLYLNIFTNSLPKNSVFNLKPVMCYIFGGGYTTGSNTTALYKPDYLLPENVVVVTINYRIGFLGFLGFEDDSLEVSGNAGLKDQSMALKWVQKNIQHFNGDPKNVTIFGNSAGACSVHYHVLSPMSKDLFAKAICQSGCALNPWSLISHVHRKIIKKLGYNEQNEKTILKILQDLPVSKLFEIQMEMAAEEPYQDSKHRLFGPIIETSTTEPTFISKTPQDILNSGEYNKVPIMLGYNDREGLFAEPLKPCTDIESSIPWMLGFKKGEQKSKMLAKELEKFYYNSSDEKQNLYNIKSDSMFLSGIVASANMHSKTSEYPVYLYKLALDTDLNLHKVKYGVGHEPGMCHADELNYLFKSDYTPEIKPNSREDIARRRICRLWTNFAKFGNPTPSRDPLLNNQIWYPVTPTQINTFEVSDEVKLHSDMDCERINFWRTIYNQSPLTQDFL